MKGVDDKPYALDQATLIRKIAEAEAERDALQATLNRVTALADQGRWVTWERGEKTKVKALVVKTDALRAALTPEGTE